MKVVKIVIQYILTIILAISLLVLILINLLSSSILNEDYILLKLDEKDYYNKIYESVQSNFENYINQSGLDEEVLNNVVTEEKIEKDTKIIISNIYNGINEDIDTEEIEKNLKQNIDNSLNRNVTQSEEQSINAFIDTISDEYKTTILNTNYEQEINSVLNNVNKYIDLVKKVLLVIIVTCIILIALLTIRRIYRILARIGVAFTIDGLIFIFCKKYIDSKVKIQTITILNDAMSEVIRNILMETLNLVMKYGVMLLSIGIVLIIAYSIIRSIKKMLREKEQYNPEI